MDPYKINMVKNLGYLPQSPIGYKKLHAQSKIAILQSDTTGYIEYSLSAYYNNDAKAHCST